MLLIVIYNHKNCTFTYNEGLVGTLYFGGYS